MYRSVVVSTFLCLAGIGVGVWAPSSVQAQSQSWVQVEALPDLRTAETRARAYGTAFSDVAGFRLRSGWYALALGPYASETEAQSRLLELRGAGVIPSDSYLSDGRPYGDQFWPIGAGVGSAPAPAIAPAPTPESGTVEDTPAAPEVAPEPEEIDETPRQARQSERLLSREDREQLQVALKWFGFYTSAIDGSFGRGTRGSMGQWQKENGFEPTGILTTKQRGVLNENYAAALDKLGLGDVVEDKAGISITMPAKLVEFDKYEYPFVQYRSKDDSGVQVLLISQAGDDLSLAGLYDVMQTLEIVPLEGERSKKRRSFTLRGADEAIQSYTFARLSGGYVKGFTLVYPPAKAIEMERVIKVMQDSFVITEGALEPSDSNSADQDVDLVAGLELRQPKLARSGFYVDGRGKVVTVAGAVESCSRITLDDSYEAELVASADGLALLAPTSNLVPLNYARFATDAGRLRSEVAVAGYSYEGALSAATVTYGTLEDIRGLTGDEAVQRLSIATLDGDVGGPVLDMSGAVTGIVKAADADGRVLPEGTVFAKKAAEVARFLSENGVTASASDGGERIAPEDLLTAGSDMTVLVGCW